MGWFTKEKEDAGDIPELPELPELPKLDSFNSKKFTEPVHQLPSFPSSSLGDKFSQNAIKEAVSREKEVTQEVDEPEEVQMMPKISRENMVQEIPENFKEAAKKVKSAEPVFVRIDKFENTLKTFNETRDKIHDIEKMLHDIKKIKEAEENELKSWEEEIQSIKEKIDKVDEEVFSKVE